MVLGRPERSGILPVPGFFTGTYCLSLLPFLHDKTYITKHIANYSVFSFGNSIAHALIHSRSRAPFSPFRQCYSPANYFIVLMLLFLSPFTNPYLTTVSTFSLVCPLQNGEFVTRSASIRKVSME